MSNEFLQAADDAKRLLSGFAAVATVAAAFEKVGSLKQAQAEAEAALPGLLEQASKAKAEVSQAKQEVKMAKQDAKDIVSKAGEAAEGIMLDATTKAAEVFADAAKSKAEAIAAVAAMHSVAQADVQALQDKCLSIEADVKDLEVRAEKARAYMAKLSE